MGRRKSQNPVHGRVNKSLLFDCILHQTNPFHTLLPFFFKIHFAMLFIILRFVRGPFPSRHSIKIFTHFPSTGHLVLIECITIIIHDERLKIQTPYNETAFIIIVYLLDYTTSQPKDCTLHQKCLNFKNLMFILFLGCCYILLLWRMLPLFGLYLLPVSSSRRQMVSQISA